MCNGLRKILFYFCLIVDKHSIPNRRGSLVEIFTCRGTLLQEETSGLCIWLYKGKKAALTKDCVNFWYHAFLVAFCFLILWWTASYIGVQGREGGRPLFPDKIYKCCFQAKMHPILLQFYSKGAMQHPQSEVAAYAHGQPAVVCFVWFKRSLPSIEEVTCINIG